MTRDVPAQVAGKKIYVPFLRSPGASHRTGCIKTLDDFLHRKTSVFNKLIVVFDMFLLADGKPYVRFSIFLGFWVLGGWGVFGGGVG